MESRETVQAESDAFFALSRTRLYVSALLFLVLFAALFAAAIFLSRIGHWIFIIPLTSWVFTAIILKLYKTPAGRGCMRNLWGGWSSVGNWEPKTNVRVGIVTSVLTTLCALGLTLWVAFTQ